jgi:hypothetical protein
MYAGTRLLAQPVLIPVRLKPDGDVLGSVCGDSVAFRAYAKSMSGMTGLPCARQWLL